MENLTVNDLSLTKDEMGVLLVLAKDSVITFQFYHHSSNVLTLYAWPKRKGKNNNPDSDGKILTINEKVEDLTDRAVLLSNFRLANDRFDLLLNAYTTVGYPFYQFRAFVGPVESSGLGLHVYYEIWGATSADKLIGSGTKITNTRNPSPPR